MDLGQGDGTGCADQAAASASDERPRGPRHRGRAGAGQRRPLGAARDRPRYRHGRDRRDLVGIALPAIGRDFHASLASLQWVVTAYTLTLAGLLLYAGGLGDDYGAQKIFLIGVVWFAVASAICGVALNAPMLIVARAVQGIGAALLTPGTLAIIEASFRQEDRSKAIGAWTGFAGVGTAIGPFLGGG